MRNKRGRVVGKIYKQGIKNKWGGDGSEQPPFEGFRLYIVLYLTGLELILKCPLDGSVHS